MGCTQYATIGMKEHVFGLQPRKIIWFQIAGLSVEHLALLKFYRNKKETRSTYEASKCQGTMWTYNLYNLRQSDFFDFQTQITGKSALREYCESFKEKPLWSYLTSGLGFKNFLIEHHSDRNNTLLKGFDCQSTNSDYFENLVLLKMGSRGLEYIKKTYPNYLSPFHQASNKKYEGSKVLFDSSCREDKCTSDLASNVTSIFENSLKNQNKFSFIIRDFSFVKLLKEKKVGQAHELLEKFGSLIQYFRNNLDEKETLILVSSSGVVPIEFPLEGGQWEDFERSGKFMTYKNKGVHSIVLSYGARSENFCGFYREHEVFKRIFQGNRKFKVELF
jgi:hypothetical protein